MKSTAQVVIIGGGVIGCSIAYFLSQKGVRDIVVLEKKGVASGATGICPGGVRQQWGTHINCELSRASTEFYQHINEELAPEYPIRFHQVGYLFLAHTETTMEHLRKNIAVQHQHQIPSRMVSAEEVGQIVPDVNTDSILGASFCQTDGFVDDAYSVTHAFAAAARRQGVAFVLAEVTEILQQANRISGVVTTKGPVKTEIVINASGLDSVQLAKGLGISNPLSPETRRLLFTNRIEERVLEPLLISLEQGFAAKQLTDGTIYLSYLGTDLKLPCNAFEFQAKVAEKGVPIFPPLERMEIRSFVDGTYDSTPDHQAVLGGVDQLPGYFQAIGMSGHGFMMAPAIGRVMAELVTEEVPSIDVSPLHLRRFETNGLIPEPSVI